MKPARNIVLLVGLVLVWGIPVYPQAPARAATPSLAPTATSSDVNMDCFGGTVKDIKKVLSTNKRDDALAIVEKGMVQRWPVYVCYLTTNETFRTKLLGKTEQSRQDKQPGATSNSSGTTSLVSKGSSPWLLGFALEHGGLTQTTDGNTITFRGNVVNSIRALLDSTYLGSYKLGENDPLVQGLAKLSFGVSFDTSSNQPSTAQGFTPSSSSFSGFSAKYEIYNHRDPRDGRWRGTWNQIAADLGNSVATPLEALNAAIEAADGFKENWEAPTFKALAALPDNPSNQEIQKVLQGAGDLFRQLYWNLPAVQAAVDHFTGGTLTYLKEEGDLFSRIRKTPLVTVEYNFTRQLTTNNQNTIATQPNQQIPNLSNINLVLEKGFQGANAPELTFNAGVTLFNSMGSTNAKSGRVRDYRVSLQLDVPLREITNVGRPTLSFSSQFLALVNEPLGQKVTLNGVTINRRGNMGVFQTKVSIPVKDSGVKIPISFTYATRTELIKEKDVRGNIGVTFDLDSLFSRAK
jgi:hypothetical protein